MIVSGTYIVITQLIVVLKEMSMNRVSKLHSINELNKIGREVPQAS